MNHYVISVWISRPNGLQHAAMRGTGGSSTKMGEIGYRPEEILWPSHNALLPMDRLSHESLVMTKDTFVVIN